MKCSLRGLAATLLIGFSLSAQQLPLKTGTYSAQLQLNQATSLPVRLTVEEKDKQRLLVIHNAEERIELKVSKREGDTLIVPFPNFDSELRFVTRKKRFIKGFWVNYNKTGNYRIPFEAAMIKNPEAITALPDANLSGNWETWFSPGTDDQEPAVGIFHQDGSRLTGTFLTETGDYRFLEGIVEKSSFYLSCFDGSHAFLITGSISGSALQGTFFSGKHYQTNWVSSRNDAFQLHDPDSLTQLKTDNSRISFTLKDIEGNNYSFPNPDVFNKVVIIQIMGTWCPNCLDETKYYKELYERYHDKGLEIISIGYEAAETFEEQAAKILRLKNRHDLAFKFLVGGKANKTLASEQFAMLNEVISFPTTIFIGKDGLVKRIHTGFNGPGTGAYYTEYVEKTNALIESLLVE